jgi:predicted RND superfamily exporter protein
LQLDRLSELFGRHRAGIAAVVIAITFAAIVGNSRLTFDAVPRNIFRSSDANFADLERALEQFGSDDNDCLLVVEPVDPEQDLFLPESIATIRRLVDRIKPLAEIDSVNSLTDLVTVRPGEPIRSLLPPPDAPLEEYRRARDEAVGHPLLKGQVLAEDAKTALIVVRLKGQALSVDQVAPVVTQLHAIAEDVSQGSPLRIRLTGVPPIRVEIFAAVQRESVKFMLVGAVLAFSMALILFRRFWAVVIVASAPILGSFWTFGLMGLIGEKVNVINSVLPTLVMVIGFTDSVHLMVDIRRSRSLGVSPLASVKAAIRHLGLPCALTSLTTAVGFGSLAVAEVDVIKRFGLVCAGGALLAFTAIMTVVPLLASSRLGLNVQTDRKSDVITRYVHGFENIIHWIMDHAWLVTVGGVALTAVLAATATRLQPDMRLTETIPQHNESYQALKHCDAVLGGTLMAVILVDWPESMQVTSPEVVDAIQAAHQVFEDEPETRYPLSLINLLESLPDAAGDSDHLADRTGLLFTPWVPKELTHRFARPDLRRASITAHLEDRGTIHHMPAFERLRHRLKDLGDQYEGFRFTLTGTVVVGSENINQMIVDLLKSLGLAAVVIFGVMTLVFRSFRLGIISVIPNTLPLVATASLLVVTGQTLQLTSVIVFSICLGVAVDDTIHFLSRFQRELKIDGNVRNAISRSFSAVGTALVTTTIVLLTGFGSVLTSDMPSSRLFGGLSCVAIVTALIGDLVILPAMLICFVKQKK